MTPSGLFTKTLQIYWRATRALTLGAQGCVITDNNRILLIKHTYRPGWHFPGGGVEKNETINSALERELREEANVELTTEPDLFGIYANHQAFPGDHIALFTVRGWQQPEPPKPNREISAHGFFAIDELPDDINPPTAARIEEIMNGKPPSLAWQTLNLEHSSLTTSQSPAAAVPISGATIRSATQGDLAAIHTLHERALGPGRYALTAYRVREGTPAVSPYCNVAMLEGRLVGAIRFTPILIGGKAGAVLLGPLAVEPRHANTGIGRLLVDAGVKAAATDGGRLVVLVGDVNYYKRFGFAPVPIGQILMPGPVNPARIMALEIVPGALGEFSGVIEAA